ncbi:MAG TPA: hypothetical protein VN633_17720 [Bryobacteraceae bacterium]|nr:hypothetical protein [Bryobacteraceae bacterium]HXR75477.1 hypothetical protein [Bryobacteraceae bacterium]
MRQQTGLDNRPSHALTRNACVSSIAFGADEWVGTAIISGTQVDATDIGKLALFSDFANSLLGETAYQCLPGGLILQFGHAGVSGSGDMITFPIPFPQPVICMLTSDMGHGGAASGAHITSSSPVDNAWANIGIYAHLDNGTPAETDVGWVAFGY